MAHTSATICQRLQTSAATALSLSNKFYRVIQILPSAVFEYTNFAELTLYTSTYLEQINQTLPHLNPPHGSKIFEDLTKLLDFLDDAYADSKEGLPQRCFDGAEVDLLLPHEVEALLHQIEALGVASNLILSVLLLGSTHTTPFTGLVTPSSGATEGFVHQTRRMVQTLMMSQPKDLNDGRRGVFNPSKRGKTHTAITEFLSQMLKDEEKTVPEKAASKSGDNKKAAEDEDNEDSADDESVDFDKVNTVKFDRFNRDPMFDDRCRTPRHPDQVYAKVPVKDVDEATLRYFGLPYTKPKDDPDSIIIWEGLDLYECDILFDHTKKLRIISEHATIDAKVVLESLLHRWTNIEAIQSSVDRPLLQDEESRRFEKDLQQLVEEDEKPRGDFGMRPIIRHERSYSPPPVIRRRAHPPRRIINRHHEIIRDFEGAKTEYWRPWGDQTSALFSSLKFRGWQPVYMRGTDAGQTWFYGQDVVHVRRFKDDYTPQDGPVKQESDAKTASPKPAEYLVISTEWIEEEALQRIGFQYQLLPSGYFSLDPRITWGDIELLIGATSTFREERLYRKYRSLPGGDLHESRRVAVPHGDFLHGPKLCDLRPKPKDVQRRKAPEPSVWAQYPNNMSGTRHGVSTRLDDVLDESVKSGDAEELNGDDAFVEVEN